MSFVKDISTLPDTKQNFGSSKNNFSLIRGAFLTKKTFSFASEEDFEDFEVWQQAMSDGDITPIHYIQEFVPQNQETIYQDSTQDYSYKSYRGKYKHILKYDWTLDIHQAVEEITESDLYIFYWDKNWNIYGVRDGSTIRGFKTNRITLEKLTMSDGNVPAFSSLDIELKDSNELNQNGIVTEVEWDPSDVDRLFMFIEIDYIDSDTLNFTAVRNGESISSISETDVSVTDNRNGALTFDHFNLAGGIYQLNTFSSELTTGILKITSDLYLGCKKYKVTVQVTVTNSIVFEDDNNWVFEDDNNWIDEN